VPLWRPIPIKPLAFHENYLYTLHYFTLFPAHEIEKRPPLSEEALHDMRPRRGMEVNSMPRILVVDDSLFARMNICDILKDAGYECLQAQNGREGLEMVASVGPDCILSDLLMPELDGIGMMTALREQGISVPVIVLSADIQETKRAQCVALGTAGFLSKPPRKNDILEMVDKVLQKA
jgi:CheY-like chemotaxis protein